MSIRKVLPILLMAGVISLVIPLAMALAQGGGGTTTIRDSDDTNFSDQSTIVLTDVPALPADQAYEGWFVSDDASRKESTGILVRDASGNINQTFWLTAKPNTLALSFSGIEPLANGVHYEGWAIIDGSPVSTGKFNVDASGNLVDLDGNVIANGEFVTGTSLSGATAIVLTIEPAGDTDLVPSTTKLLGGAVSGLSANLAVSHSAALGDDFLGASGKYILATPTDDPEANENSGIWFLDLSSGTPAQGLQLPSLPTGWIYEGWVVIDGTPVSTGRFSDPVGADLDAPHSGPNPGPAFPGEDFLVNAPAGLTFPTNLAGATAVISIEPVPDDSEAPFTLKPLTGAITGDATDHVTYSMDNQAAGFPTGAATILAGQPTGENLFADFDKFVVTIEPIPDPDPGPSAVVAYIHAIPAGGILHIRHLLFSLGSNPPYSTGFHAGTPKGLAVGLREQTDVALTHARLSLTSTTLANVQLHACHVINIVEGTGDKGGTNFDSSCGNPGDDFGVLNYSADTALHAGLADSAAAADPVIAANSPKVIASADLVTTWATDARDLALLAKGSNDVDAAKLFIGNARDRLVSALDAAKGAYVAAQDMGTYTLAVPAGPVVTDPKPPPTGDPHLPNIALAALLTGAFLLISGAFIYRRSRRRA